MSSTRKDVDWKQLLTNSLRSWPLFEPGDSNHIIDYHIPDNGGQIWVGYALRSFSPSGYRILDLNVIEGESVVYLTNISLPLPIRGRGHGSSLYDVVCCFAESAGMREVRTFPSGWTSRGESRRDWLIRRGWTPYEDQLRRVFVDDKKVERDKNCQKTSDAS